MTVWLVSLSTLTLKVGSSSDSLTSAFVSLSWSDLLLGSIATETTGSGKMIVSSMTGSDSSQMVSPVKVFLRPTAAAMLPELTDSFSSRRLACMIKTLPNRSLMPLVELYTYDPDLTSPE